ncbi:hypothetical protein E2C01_027918 [Portunus trituberculatus]|uniref:Uncharacterized protein n=1 Tax=Portunus trituberculatus TaxID=210409 RepID=A0A5B7EM76_PORTR|nr:hypothetical protein [Portunus trituberculatus]
MPKAVLLRHCLVLVLWLSMTQRFLDGPLMLCVSQTEVQVSDTWEEKPLPKGVSPCALQLNRHFAETGSLPQHITEVATSHVTPSPPTKTSSGVTPAGAASAPVATSPVRTSRVMLSSAKKIVGRASRLASRNPRQSPLTAKSVRNSSIESLPTPASAPASEGQKSRETEQPNKQPTMQGTVSLESLVEMLKVVQKFPAGSNLYTSVLQLVERLIHSMKDNIGHQCKTEVEEESEAPALPASPKVAASSTPPGSYVLSKGQKLVSGSSVQTTQVNHSSSYPPTNVAIPMATPVSLFPLTVFSAMPSTVSSGPKVARVAPVAPVAPTTVVSSPGLTRTVRVCVAEAPHLEEPPLKKHREEVGLLPDYTLVRGSQFPSEQQMTSPAVASVVSTASSFNSVNPLLSSKIVSQCTSQEALGEASPAIDALQGQLRIPDSQEVSDMHVPVSDPLLSQGPGLCGVLPSSSTMAQAPATQESVASTCVTSSALTRSDPLLSQSSPVAPLQMEAGASIPATSTENSSRPVRAGDGLIVSNSNSQVSMQNEVTSAINLSETELLNYFDPNCFDNAAAAAAAVKQSCGIKLTVAANYLLSPLVWVIVALRCSVGPAMNLFVLDCSHKGGVRVHGCSVCGPSLACAVSCDVAVSVAAAMPLAGSITQPWRFCVHSLPHCEVHCAP